MTVTSRIASAALAAALGCAALAPRPAAADGAAVTRNILFGAAAVGGTLLIVNHNKKVHQKEAEYDQRQAEAQAEANQAQAAYESEKRAYAHEAALVGEYRQEVAYQHRAVRERDAQIASLERSLIVAKAGGHPRTLAFAQHSAHRSHAHGNAAHSAVPARPAVARASVQPAQVVSYGWGAFDLR